MRTLIIALLIAILAGITEGVVSTQTHASMCTVSARNAGGYQVGRVTLVWYCK